MISSNALILCPGPYNGGLVKGPPYVKVAVSGPHGGLYVLFLVLYWGVGVHMDCQRCACYYSYMCDSLIELEVPIIPSMTYNQVSRGR